MTARVPADAERTDVLIVGGGPAGLTAGTELRAAGVERVVVLERESAAGGIPRHSDHPGFGIRDRHRSLSGPQYARLLDEQARDAGVEVRTQAMATDWVADRALAVTSASGRRMIEAGAIVLATGARERPRTARLVPGDRPAGVLTTGLLQNLVHGRGDAGLVGRRAVVVGSELVSWSAVLTLRQAGCRTVLMVADRDRLEVPIALRTLGRTALNLPIARRARVSRVLGRDRVEAVELENLDTGQRRVLECDTVVFTGDWIPDNELARARGVRMNDEYRGPIVDTALRTSAPGVFAAGNLVHPVDTADVAALDGRHVSAQVLAFLAGFAPSALPVRLRAGAGFAWVSPGVMHRDGPAPARGRLLLWPEVPALVPRVRTWQGGRLLASRRLPWPMAPGRMFRVPWSLVADALPGAGDVVIELSGG